MYSSRPHFFRLLRLLSNDIMHKAKRLIGEELLEDPEQSLANIKLALRVCAEFRGCYLDFRERSEEMARKHREQVLARGGDDVIASDPPASRRARLSRGGAEQEAGSGRGLCPWPPRNSPVFAPLNAVMERCNDLLELVQTLLDFK